jgi:glycosyltransferase involved in cell wall biosynthesis
MRVTLLSKALVVGAYQRKCELIAAHSDIELTVLVPPSWGTQPLERTHTSNYDLRVLPIRFNGNFHLHYYPTLAQELRRSQPDVLHIDEEPYNLATWLAIKAHNHAPLRRLFFSWQNINRTYPPPFRWMERDVLRKADAAIVGNRDAEQVWRAKGFIGAVHVLPQFGVDEGVFTFASLPSPRRGEGVCVIGYFGRLVHEKGVDLLIHALAQLPPDTTALIVGAGPAEAELKSLAKSLDVENRIVWQAQVPSTDMPALYQRVDALVLPSRTLHNWKEQFGRVLIEAMACGVPVIGARSGEIPNVVGDAGLLFDEGKVPQLAECIKTLINQPELRADFAHKGRARVLEQFTMKRIADQTVDVYRDLSRV